MTPWWHSFTEINKVNNPENKSEKKVLVTLQGIENLDRFGIKSYTIAGIKCEGYAEYVGYYFSEFFFTEFVGFFLFSESSVA